MTYQQLSHTTTENTIQELFHATLLANGSEHLRGPVESKPRALVTGIELDDMIQPFHVLLWRYVQTVDSVKAEDSVDFCSSKD